MPKSNSKIEQYHLHKLHPEMLQFELYSLKEYRIKSGEKAAIPHSHSYYQIIWFFNGGGTHTVDFKTYDIEDNTILFITKDQIHSFDDDLEIEGWLIHFNESFFMHSDVDIFLKYNLFNSQHNPCYPINNNLCDVVNNYIKLIKKELDKRGSFGYEDVVRFLLKAMLINLERIHQKDTTKKIELNSQYELQFFKYKELIEAHYKDGFSVNHYADLLHISSKTLTTITKNIIGKSPSQLIAERTILEAKRLLRFTALQIGEVAFKIGFDDASYFVKYFKRHVGSSPKSYRDTSS